MGKSSPQKDYNRIIAWYSREVDKLDEAMHKVRGKRIGSLERKLGKKLNAREKKWHKKGYSKVI